MHYLCHMLNEMGYEAYITVEQKNPWLRTPQLTQEVRNRHQRTHRVPIAVYPETVSGNPLGEAIVARWLLNKAGHLGGESEIAPEELVFFWDDWVLQGEPHQGRLYVPIVDRRIFNEEAHQVERTGFCYYAHKYLRFGGKIAESIRNNGISLCQDIPRSPEEIAEILRSAKVIYCYEPSSILAEAYHCGCPSMFVKTDYLDQFELSHFGVPKLPESEIDFGFNPGISPYRADFIHSEELKAQESVKKFADMTQRLAQEAGRARQSRDRQQAVDLQSGAPPAALRSPLVQWLGQRSPSATQARLISNYLSSSPTTLSIFVRTSSPLDTGLVATLASIKALQTTYRIHAITVLGMHAADPDIPQLDCLPDAPTREAQVKFIQSRVHSQACDWLLVVNAGDCLTPSGLLCIVSKLRDAPHLRAVYADSFIRHNAGTLDTAFRPDFNLDMLLSFPAVMAQHWLIRREAFLEVGGFNVRAADAPELDLLLRLINNGGLEGLGHVHEPLLITAAPVLRNNAHEMAAIASHLQARGYDQARVDAHRPGRYRIHYGHPATPLVSIVIPTKDQFALLERCVSSLLEQTTYPNYEVLLIDNGSTDPATCAWLDGIAKLGEVRIRVIRHDSAFNYAELNNHGAREARGDYLLLLNNDTAIVQADWLDALLNHAQRPEVGVVGAKLLYPGRKVQHAGLLLGLHGMAGYPFSGAEANAPGYMHRLEIDQNYSAVSAACMMVRRSLYEELGGMDANAFPLICGDMDLCLRARAAGYLTVWTPHAVLLHEKGATLTAAPPADFAEQRARAQDEMYRRWLPELAHDPAYNRNLSLQSTEFAVETDTRLNWNPLPWRPLPVILAINADKFACGHYRIIHPGQGMARAGLADVRVSEYHYGPVEIERLKPDTWVLQRIVSDAPFEMVRRTAPFTQAFKVAELDDYLLGLPMKSVHRGQLPQELNRTLRRWLDLTDRLVVSTTPLANAMEKLHRDIRVVPNRLPPDPWGQLVNLRRQGRRPRVGWSGGSSHQGDLELIADVVKILADEVEWVFLGMCPEPMRKYLHEHHTPVLIEVYPQKLASLNLDLAIAPLENHLFNDCKSNLKLLEYGACGYPVVCSDVAAYRCDLPVTRVKNRYKDWVDAIRMHLSDLHATASAGDALRDAVRRHWLLDDQHLESWLTAWSYNK